MEQQKLCFPKKITKFYVFVCRLDVNIKIIKRTGPNLENIENLYQKIPRIHIGKLPIMLKSNICILKQYNHLNNITGECKYDGGGYFIINGSEKH